jgi:hypothetical protein
MGMSFRTRVRRISRRGSKDSTTPTRDLGERFPRRPAYDPGMGHVSVVYGVIVGAPLGFNADRELLHRANVRAVGALPEHDDWPPLVRSMFSVVDGPYKRQAIHFGATFKELEWSWEAWLEKFERLLAKTFWDDVRLHLVTEWTGEWSYRYGLVATPYDAWAGAPPRQPSGWTLQGGPRDFGDGVTPAPDLRADAAWERRDAIWVPRDDRQ